MKDELINVPDGGDKDSFKTALENLRGLDSMFTGFFESEGEGMVICENCLDNVFEDDEDVCTAYDDNGFLHVFCCKECLDEWKKGL